ncbi:hypothetical protein TrVE_jg4181 [Triparma verrucosa]|uniref:Uncharacterized protein n=1 Tax=Triparma verrucosa TaxID=1606542 RepID=A0A9W7ESY8_9STRA|nr:hypothetical protein TrVE_jg4181 [Triparma verrucosa]
MSENHAENRIEIPASQLESLKAELKEAVALLQAEREAKAEAARLNAEAVARLNAEKEEAVAQLDAERKAKDEAARNLTAVVEINSDATFQARRRRADGTATSVEPLDPDNPMVRKVGANVLNQNTTINDCRTDVTIHEEPEVLLEALLGNQTKVGKMLYQKIVEKGVFYWSFMVDNIKSCDLLLRMQVDRQDQDGVVVGVESVEEEELEATSLPNPHSTATKKVRLLLKEGIIILRLLLFGQTLFTFTAQVDVVEVTKDATIVSPGLFVRSPTSVTRAATIAGITSAITGVTSRTDGAMKMVGVVAEAVKASELFSRLANLFFERLKKEDVIDERRKANFIENGIPNAPPLTEAEENLIAKSMGQVDVAGVIPKWIVNKKIPEQLQAVQDAINEFRQDDRIDASDREEFSELMEERWSEEVNSQEEKLLIDKGQATIKAIMSSANPHKVLESGDPLVTIKSAHLDGDKLGTAIGESILDGGMEEVVAFECLKMSREATRNFHKKGGIKNIVKKML